MNKPFLSLGILLVLTFTFIVNESSAQCIPPAGNCAAPHIIRRVLFAGIDNSSSCGVNAYTDYSTALSAANVTANTSATVSVYASQDQTFEYGGVWIDFDQDGQFETGEFTEMGRAFLGQPITKSIQIPSDAKPGITKMRIRVRPFTVAATDACSNFILGETEDYGVNITNPTYGQCTGVPALGTATGPSTACAGQQIMLYMAGTFMGLTKHWESSPKGANTFTGIPASDTNRLYITQNASTDYRLVVSCLNTGETKISNIVSVYTAEFCYCAPPYGNFSINYSIDRVKFGSIDNSTGSSFGNADYTGTIPPADVVAGRYVPISVSVASLDGSAGVWIDFNKNGQLEASEFKELGPGYTKEDSILIPHDAVTGITRMRVRRSVTGSLGANEACVQMDGEYEDYNVNILAPRIALHFDPFKDTLYNKVLTLTMAIGSKMFAINTTDNLKPRVWARNVNGGSWKSFKGTLASGTATEGTWKFDINHDSLGVRRNGCDSILYYFVAQDLDPVSPFIAYTPYPGALHQNVATPVTPPTRPFGYRIRPRFKDTVYVGVNNYLFSSLTDEGGLFYEMQQRDMEGDMTVLIESDTREAGRYSLKGARMKGFKLTIKPASANEYRINVRDSIPVWRQLSFEDVSNVEIDGSYNGNGRYLRFYNIYQYANSPGDTTSTISISGVSNNVTVKNAIFEYNNTSVDRFATAAIYLGRGTNTNISILNNVFTGTLSMPLAASYVVSAGNNQALVRKNEFGRVYFSHIKVEAPGHNWIIDSNHFYRDAPAEITSPDYRPIYLSGGGHLVRRNYIGGRAAYNNGGFTSLTSDGLGNVMAICITNPAGADSSIVEENHISHFELDGSNFTGIYVANNNAKIRNNIIGDPLVSNATIRVSSRSQHVTGIFGTGGTSITGNEITGFTSFFIPISGNHMFYGINVSNAANGLPSGNKPLYISGNKIHKLENLVEKGSITAINLSGGSGNIIEKNLLYDLVGNSGALTGISYASDVATLPNYIRQNKMYRFQNNEETFGSLAITGISVSGDAGGVDVINNQVSFDNNLIPSRSNIIGLSYGNNNVYQPPPPALRVLYNSIFIGGTAKNQAFSAGLSVGNRGIKAIYNNVFFNARTGDTNSQLAYYSTSLDYFAGFLTTASNHNFFVLPDTSAFAKWPNVPVHGSGLWQSKYHADDTSVVVLSNTVAANDLFVSIDSGNLLINPSSGNSWLINNKAKPFSGVTGDFLQEDVRPADVSAGPADIGSHEFTPTSQAPGSICEGRDTSFVTVAGAAGYQWQTRKGNAAFTNVTDDAHHTGANAATLKLISVLYAANGQEYRCLVNGAAYAKTYILAVNPSSPPTVTISTPSTALCVAGEVTFTATVINGGSSPVYQWKKNGTAVGSNSNVYKTSAIANDDKIQLTLTSGNTCAPATVESNILTMTVAGNQAPQVIINGNTTVENGMSTSLTASATAAGNNPAYQWQDSTQTHNWLNIAGATGSTVNYLPASTGDKVRCIITSTAACSAGAKDTSSVLRFQVGQQQTGGTLIASMHPNPVSNTLYIEDLRLVDHWQTLQIKPLNGSQSLITVNIINQTRVEVPVANLPAGMYMITLISVEGNVVSFKMLKI